MYAAPIDGPWDGKPSGTYWTPPPRGSLAEINPMLMAKLVMISDRQHRSIYDATALDMESGRPIGQLDVAVEETAKRAYGPFDHYCQATHAPRVFAFRGDGDAAIQALYAIAHTEGYVL
jgi:hypothetical protein